MTGLRREFCRTGFRNHQLQPTNTSTAFPCDLTEKAVETTSLIASWCAFSGSVVVILTNQLLGYYAADRMLSILDDEFGGETVDFFTAAHNRQVELHRRRLCEWMDYSSLALFVAGIVCLAYFVSVNF